MSKKMKSRSKMPEKSQILEIICPICQSILIEPVSMPCKHVLCRECFDNTMTTSNLVCPLCRKRLSTWLRRANKEKRLVDVSLWEHIQKKYPKEVKAKLNGDEEDSVLKASSSPPKICLSSQGEIRKEFEIQMKKHEEEEMQRRREEEIASIEFIKQIQAEELPLIQKKRQEVTATTTTEALATTSSSSSSTSSSTSASTSTSSSSTSSSYNHDSLANKENKKGKGTLDNFIINGKRMTRDRNQLLASTDNHENIDRCKAEQNRSVSAVSTSSHDSINQELHHFKPIKIVPRTPPKRLPDGQIVEPKIIKTTPVNLNLVYDSMEVGNESTTFTSTSFNQKLMAVKNDCLNRSQSENNDSAFKGCGINNNNINKNNPTATKDESESKESMPTKKIKLDTDFEKYLESGEISSEFATEQRRLQELIEIENSDMLLALRLDQEWSTPPSSSTRRQSSLKTSPKTPKSSSSASAKGTRRSTSNGGSNKTNNVRHQPKRLCKQRTIEDMFSRVE